MFKRTLITAAASLFLGTAAFADVSGTYLANTEQGPITIELHPDQGHLAGTLTGNGKSLPVMAGEFGDRVNGVVECEGRPVAFTATLQGTSLNLNTNGVTYRFEKTGAAAANRPAAGPVEVRGPITAAGPIQPQSNDNPLAVPTPQNQPLQPAQPAAQQAGVQQGQYFRFAVPAGWQHEETPNGVDLVGPDGITAASHALIRGQGNMTAQQFTQLLLQSLGQKISNLRIVSSQEVPGQAGPCLVTEGTYITAGKPAHGLMIVTVSSNAGSYFVDALVIQAPEESWKQNVQMLMNIAQSVTPANADQAPRNAGPIRPGNNYNSAPAINRNQPVDDASLRNGYESRNQSMDRVIQRQNDALRGHQSSNTPAGFDGRNPNVWANNNGPMTGSNSRSHNSPDPDDFDDVESDR